MSDHAFRKAVFLDRDGVLNRSDVRNGRPYAPVNLASFEILPEAPGAVKRLHDGGYLTIVVTNQRDVGRGIVSPDVLDEMHRRLREAMPIDDIFVCTSLDDRPRYKPAPGMLLEARDKWAISLAESFMIGDRWRDVGAGRNAGCSTIFVDRDYVEPLRERPDHTVVDIAEAAALILGETATATHLREGT